MNDSIATFSIAYAFQLTGRKFYILGDITSGSITIGMIADFTQIGIDKKHFIESIEISTHRDYDTYRSHLGLGFSTLTAEEKELLKTRVPFKEPIEIRSESNS